MGRLSSRQAQGTRRIRVALSLVLQSRLVHVPELQRGMHFGGAREKVAGKRGISVAPCMPVSLFLPLLLGIFCGKVAETGAWRDIWERKKSFPMIVPEFLLRRKPNS